MLIEGIVIACYAIRSTTAIIYIRGEVDNIGPTVPRGFLTVLTPGSKPTINSQQSGRRELADWLTDKANPLTARVMANRVWLNLFGDGLVRTADNFGATGEKPGESSRVCSSIIGISSPPAVASSLT